MRHGVHMFGMEQPTGYRSTKPVISRSISNLHIRPYRYTNLEEHHTFLSVPILFSQFPSLYSPVTHSSGVRSTEVNIVTRHGTSRIYLLTDNQDGTRMLNVPSSSLHHRGGNGKCCFVSSTERFTLKEKPSSRIRCRLR